MTGIETLIKKAGRVAVLYGGTSSERSVSLASGAAVVQALREKGFDVLPLDLRDEPLQQILTAKPDTAFIALHGPGGEDGKIQALLEFLGIPYTGSGVAASALCMDKLRTKQLWRGVDLPTPDYFVLTENTNWHNVMALGEEVIVKPCHDGSSYGITRVCDESELANAFHEASKFDQLVIAERFIRGGEYTVAILGDRALPPIKLETDHRIYDFDAKYTSNDTRYLCPCGLDERKTRELQELALAAFHAVGARGWGRVDVMEESGAFYLLEINTVPGMTDHSLVPIAAKAEGCDFNSLVVNILQKAVKI